MDGCPANMTWAHIDDKYDTTNFSYCKFPITKKIGGTMTGRYGAARYKKFSKISICNQPLVVILANFCNITAQGYKKIPQKRNLNMKGHQKMIHAP
jgi:hypothetical protein